MRESIADRRRKIVATAACLSTLLATACAGPALKRYVLNPEVASPSATSLGRTPVIEVVRIALPDYLDTRNIVVRRGALLDSSHVGRWAERLSIGVTDFVTRSLAARRPDALVTDQPQVGAPAYRIIINISRLDLTSDGGAILDAEWLVVSADKTILAQSGRGRFEARGSTKTDGDVVALETQILQELSAALPVEALK